MDQGAVLTAPVAHRDGASKVLPCRVPLSVSSLMPLALQVDLQLSEHSRHGRESNPLGGAEVKVVLGGDDLGLGELSQLDQLTDLLHATSKAVQGVGDHTVYLPTPNRC